MLILILLWFPGSATAAIRGPVSEPPPLEYQHVIFAHYRTPTGAEVPLRRGWWDPTTPRSGFGFDKILNKHGITNMSVVQHTIEEPATIEPAGPTRTLYRGRFVKNECDTTSCRETESVWVKTVVDIGPWSLLDTGEPTGVNTSYCEGMPVCPEWINDVDTAYGADLAAGPS